MFDFMGRLYQTEAKVPPGGNEFELTLPAITGIRARRLEPLAGGNP
jgi:hypothetical protein